jgi:hypothetical protein
LGPKQLSLFDMPPSPEAHPEQSRRVGRGAGGEGDGQDPFAEETLERIKGDSFYGQTHISLPEIERRLEETAATVGSPEEIQRFLFSGLNRFSCSVTDNPDGSWRIAVTHPALQTASVGEVIERATFDAEWALDDPDLTLLDVGHPLVRRLIEEVKQNAFRGMEHYGRTAYVVTPDVDEVTALFHLLARYVVNTDPTSIVEELLPVAVPVYRLEPDAITGDPVEPLVNPEPSRQTRTEGEVQEVLDDALGIAELDRLLEGAVEERRQELVAERTRMRRRALRNQMEQQKGSQPAEWLEGIDDLAPGSFDLLTVTVLFPV